MPSLKYWDVSTSAWKTLPTFVAPPPTVALDPWHTVRASADGSGEPVFQNNWSAYTAGTPPYAPVGFRKDPMGIVRLRGVLLSGNAQTANAGTTAFQLPSGYRPPFKMVLDTTETIGQKTLVVNPDGTVTSGMALSAGTGLLLDGLQFDTETVTQLPTGPQGPKGDTGGNATVPMDTWHIVGTAGEPVWGSGTVASSEPVGFRKDPMGKVSMKGPVKLQTAGVGTTAFTLPTGYYLPNYYRRFPVNCENASGTFVGIGRCYIGLAGQVVVDNLPSTTIFVDLTPVEFDTELVTQLPTGPQGPKGDTGGNATVPMDPWHTVGAVGEPAFGSGWGPQSGYTVQFRKDPLGKVMVHGRLQCTAAWTFSANNLLFTLPAGYWPSYDALFKVIVTEPSGANSSAVHIYAVVSSTNGGIRLIGAIGSAAPTGASGSYCFIDEIDFDTGTVTQMPTGPQGPKGDPGNAAVVPLVSALPSNPTDGQQIDFQTAAMAVDGVRWRFTYSAAAKSAGKSPWEFVGGTSLYAEYLTDVSASMGTGAWGSFDTNDPRVTVPLIGDYLVRHVAGMVPASAQSTCGIGLLVGSTYPVTGSNGAFSTVVAGLATTISQTRKLLGVAANSLIRQAYFQNGGVQNLLMRNRELDVVPIRVG